MVVPWERAHQHTYTMVLHTSTTGTPGVFSWSWNVRTQNSISSNRLGMLPDSCNQQAKYYLKAGGLRRLVDSKFRVSKLLLRLSRQGKDGLINSLLGWKLTVLCSVFCPWESHQPADMMFPLILKWGEGSWDHRGFEGQRHCSTGCCTCQYLDGSLTTLCWFPPNSIFFSSNLSAALKRKH